MIIKNSIKGNSVASLLLYGTVYYSDHYFDNVTVSEDETMLDNALYNTLCLIENGQDVLELGHMSVKGALQRVRSFSSFDAIKEHIRTIKPKNRIPVEFFNEMNDIIFEEFKRKDAYPYVCDKLDVRSLLRTFNKLKKGKNVSFNPYCSTYRDVTQPYACLGCPYDLMNNGKCLNDSPVYQHTVCFTYNCKPEENCENTPFKKIVKEFATQQRLLFKRLVKKEDDVIDETTTPSYIGKSLMYQYRKLLGRQRTSKKYDTIIKDAIDAFDVEILV